MITASGKDYDFNGALDRIEALGPGDAGRVINAPRGSAFASEDFAQRYARLTSLMAAEGIDGALLTQEENVQYFTGYLTVLWVSKFRPLVAMLPTDSARPSKVVVSGQELGNARTTSWVDDIVAFSPQAPPIPYIAKAITDSVGDRARVGIEIGFGQRLGMNLQQLQALQSELPRIEFVDITPLAQTVRMLKSPREIMYLQSAARISTAAVESGWRALRVGMNERELASLIGAEMYRLGAEVTTSKPSFFGIMGGARRHLANAVADGLNELGPGDLVLVDGGASYRGYVTDFIRQAALAPVDDATSEWFGIAVAANRAAVSAMRPGVRASHVYDTAMAVFREHDVEEFNGSTIVGHGIGADVHELPWLGQADTVFTSDVTVRENMVFSVEPVLIDRSGGPYPHGMFIVEEMVAVTRDGTELLTDGLAPDLFVIPVPAQVSAGKDKCPARAQ